MRLLSTVGAVAVLFQAAAAQADGSQILSQIPSCALNCTLSVLETTKCPLGDITALPQCLCPNATIQLNIGVCVLSACSPGDQAVTSTLLQSEVCKGFPVPSRSAELIRTVIIIAAVAFPAVGLRFVARYMVVSSWWWDDWSILLAAFIMVPMTVIPIYNATKGFGKHFWDVPPENLEELRKLYYISQILYSVVQTLPKFSILFLYLRVFTTKRFQFLTKFVLVWMVFHTIVLTLVVSLQCLPVPSVWDVTIKGKCINLQAFIYAAAGFAIFENLIIISMPIFEIKGLNLDFRRKAAVMFIFMLGFFACITSIVRLKYIISFSASIDQTYDNIDVIIWSVLESFMAVICASMMCIRPLIVKLFPSLFQRGTVSKPSFTPTTPWSQKISSRLTSKMRTEDDAIELGSEDGEGGIRIQKMWVINSTGPKDDHTNI